VAFIPQHDGPGARGFTYGNVQGVAGGFMVLGDRLRFFFSARSGSLGNGTAGTGTGNLTCVTMVAHLRRNGFAHVGLAPAASAAPRTGWLLTRPLSYAPPRDARGLWLNCNTSSAGAALRIEVLQGGATIARSQTVSGVDSTRLLVPWRGVDPAPRLSSNVPFRLKVFFAGPAALYAFWVSPDRCGTSGGAIAAGGPGHTTGRDRQCT
jgi:hypothetical protein